MTHSGTAAHEEKPVDDVSSLGWLIGACQSERVARILKLNPGVLDKLDIYPCDNADYFGWKSLTRCLENARHDDALVIFRAMAVQLKNEPFGACIDLIERAFLSAEWGLEAIGLAPELFLKHQSSADSSREGRTSWATNSIQVLSLIEYFDDEPDPIGYLDALGILCALKDIGAYDVHIDGAGTSLRYAARYREAPALRAFLETFPDSVNATDSNKLTVQRSALHHAAESNCAENIRVLLEFGANPRPCNSIYDSPLCHAVMQNKIDNAITLIDTGCFSVEDIDALKEDCENDDFFLRMKAYHASLRAREVLNNDYTVAIKPL